MMHKKHILIGVIVLLLGVIVFIFARPNADDNEKKVNLYFIDKGGYTLVPVETKISAKTNTELYEKVAEKLIEGPESKKYLPVLGKDVKLNKIHFLEGKLVLDFSSEYPETNYLSSYAIIKTFSKLAGVSVIQITEDGNGIMGSDGAALGFVSGGDINTEAEGDTATGIRLYFANSGKDRLVVEFRKINIVDTRPVEQYIVAELIKGPEVSGNERLLSQDTKILAVETRDGTCYVNFKKGFVEKNMLSSDQGKLVIESVVRSLTELESVDTVQFLVDGKKTATYGETDLREQFETEDTGEVIVAE